MVARATRSRTDLPTATGCIALAARTAATTMLQEPPAQDPLSYDPLSTLQLQLPVNSNVGDLVGLPVPNSTHSYWINTPGANPLADYGSTDDIPSEADVCIIGAGITGVSTAYHLSRAEETKGLKTVILEARDFCMNEQLHFPLENFTSDCYCIGSGATGRNGGHLTPQVFESFKRREDAYGTVEAKKSVDIELHNSVEVRKIIQDNNLDEYVDLVAGGHIVYLDTEHARQKLTADFYAAKAAGVDFTDTRYISAEEMEQVNIWEVTLSSLTDNEYGVYYRHTEPLIQESFT